ncbi:MAG: hypothetical protein ACPIOQ_31850, partial [Promethearchaeia archaeon]
MQPRRCHVAVQTLAHCASIAVWMLRRNRQLVAAVIMAMLAERAQCSGAWCGASTRRTSLRLRGGQQRVSPLAQDILEAVEACERGPCSITSEVVFERPQEAGRRRIGAGMLEALRDLADMPMCNESLAAFDARISLPALLLVVNGTVDGTPIEPLGTQALATRGLHKLCATARTTPELDGLCASRSVLLTDLLHVMNRVLEGEDEQAKWHALDTVGLLARDSAGARLLHTHAVVPRALRCLRDADTDVFMRVSKVAATLALGGSGSAGTG